jgi:hypothetical protein
MPSAALLLGGLAASEGSTATGPRFIAGRLLGFAAFGSLLLGLPAEAAAPPWDLAVKAAFLARFGGYVAWPPSARPAPGQPFALCVIGSDPFGRILDQAARDEQVGGRPIQIRRLPGLASSEGCHVAFVQGTAASSTEALLQALQARPVLTITDSRAGESQGIIHFVVHQRRVRFQIDEAAASRSGLSISSRLLGIALSVRRDG